MRKCLKIIFASLFVILMFQSAALADSPIGIYFPSSGDMKISGSFHELPQDNTVNLIALKSPADYLSFNANDIFYIASADVNADGSYEFVFHSGDEYGKLNVYIKAENTYEPVEIIKLENPGYIAMTDNAELYASSSVISVGSEAETSVKVFGKNGSELDNNSYELYSDNPECVSTDGGKIRGIKKGSANVYAAVSIYENTIKTKPVKIIVRDSIEPISVIGVTMKNGNRALDIAGDISDADGIVFSFDRYVDIDSIEMLNLKTGEKTLLTGSFDTNSKSYSVSLDKRLGYGKYRFLPNTSDGTYIAPFVEGCDFSLSVSENTAIGCTYKLDFKLYNYRGYSVPVSNAVFFGNGVNGTEFSPTSSENVIFVSFVSDGKEKYVQSTVHAENIEKIIPQIKNLRMETGTSQRIDYYAVGADGGILDIVPEFSVSNNSKVSVSENGILKAKQQGTAVITIKCCGIFSKFKVYVGVDGNPDVFVGNVTDIPKSLEIGEKRSISAYSVTLSGVKNKYEGCVFNSDNKNVIQVTENSIIEAKDCGTAVISTVAGGETVKARITVIPIAKASAELIVKSSALPLGKYDTPNVITDANEFLSYGEYELYSDNSDIVSISDNKIYAKSKGTAGIYAVLSDGIVTDRVNINVFEPAGGYFTDEMKSTDNIFYMDSDLKLSERGIMSDKEVIRPMSFIYKLSGDINNFIIYDYICNPSYESEDVYVYVSPDNVTYTELSGIERIKGQQINGWGTDSLVRGNVPSGMRYLKITLNNQWMAQATIISGVEIGFGGTPEVIDFKVTDDSFGEESYKNIIGRKAVVTFNQPVNPDTLENISVSDGENAGGYYDNDLCRYEFALSDKSYDSVSVDVNGVLNYNGDECMPFSAELDRLDGTYSVLGNKIYAVDEKLMSEKIIIKNDTLFYKKYIVISAVFDENGKLVSCEKSAEGNVNPADTTYVFAAHDKNAKVFVWESLSSAKPVVKAVNEN